MVASVEKPQHAMTDQSTHIIDPDGEAIIVLHNPNAPFAEQNRTVPEPKPAAEEPAENGTSEQPDENCIRIQVSAKHLALASPVFKKIMTGSWKESIAYLEKGSVEITADGWGIEALLILLHIIHCQFYRIPRKLTLEMLAEIAVLADYYDCKEAVDFFASTWITTLDKGVPTVYCRDLIIWLWVAWYFQLPAQFEQATSVATSWSTNWVGNLGLPIPENVMNSVNDRRQEAISGLVLQLHNKCDQLLHGQEMCAFECSSIMYGALAKQMHSKALFSPKPAAPFPDLSYRFLVQTVSSFKSPVWYENSWDYSSSYGKQPKQHKCQYSTFGFLFGELNYTIEGLSLGSHVHK